SMDACRELEQKYGLAPADKKQRQEGLPLKAVRYEEGDIKHQIANVIRSIARDYHFQSLKEYEALLTIYNIGMEEVRGEAKGKPYQGLIYSALNDKGEKVGSLFKSSLFGKPVGIPALEKRIEKSAEIIKNKGLKERSKKVIASAMRSSKNRQDFEKTLEKQGMGVLFRINEQGRIYGVTFIDHEQKCVFNGSRLGKEFSANVFNDFFNGSGQKQEQSDHKAGQVFETFENVSRERENSDMGGIFDILPIETQEGEDFEAEALMRRLKKKKKKSIRRL
ncbi:hypothetical protein EZS27_015261, partial [termite gut metagenome]